MCQGWSASSHAAITPAAGWPSRRTRIATEAMEARPARKAGTRTAGSGAIRCSGCANAAARTVLLEHLSASDLHNHVDDGFINRYPFFHGLEGLYTIIVGDRLIIVSGMPLGMKFCQKGLCLF